MDKLEIKAAVGTMAWGSRLWGKLIQGSSVDEEMLKTVIVSAEVNMPVIDTVYKYGIGYAENLLGKYGSEKLIYSAKFTPLGAYRKGGLTKAFYKDMKCLGRDYADIYWLHLPRHIERNLAEMAELYKAGKIKNIGVSNFNMAEVLFALKTLAGYGIPLYGVQNHFSLLSRDWETNGMIKWCKDNGVSFWAWSILEEGALTGKARHFPWYSVHGILFNKRIKKSAPLFDAIKKVGSGHNLSTAQVSLAWAASKGIVPVNGCRKPYQVKELAKAVAVALTEEEICMLEKAADCCNARVSADMFRFAAEKKSYE